MKEYVSHREQAAIFNVRRSHAYRGASHTETNAALAFPFPTLPPSCQLASRTPKQTHAAEK